MLCIQQAVDANALFEASLGKGHIQQDEAARVYPVSVKVFIGLSAASATERGISIHGAH